MTAPRNLQERRWLAMVLLASAQFVVVLDQVRIQRDEQPQAAAES